MSRKSFHICVDFDVHAVTCPGVWLCPKGRVVLRITMFGLSVNTKTLTPSFPLLFHEKFRFHKMLRTVNSLTTLQQVLKSRSLQMQFIHIAATQGCTPTTVLATFKSPLSDVFYPSPSDRGLNAGVDVDLLLRPTECFPGIISPKVEISTRVVIEEVVNYSRYDHDTWIVNPVTIPSKKTDGGTNIIDDGNMIRQRPVCHTQMKNPEMEGGHCTYCLCYKKVPSMKPPPFLAGKVKRGGRPSFAFMKSNLRPSRIQRKRYRNRQLADNSDYSNNCMCTNIISKKVDAEESPSKCDCILCKKYKDYFPSSFNNNECSTPEDSPKTKEKLEKCLPPGQNKLKKKLGSSHPLEAGDAGATDRNAKIKHKPPPKMGVTVSKLPMESVAEPKSYNGCTCGMINKSASSPERQQTSYEIRKNGVGSSKQKICRLTSPIYKSQTLQTQAPTTSARNQPGEKPKETCRCGIYSCPEWQSSKGRELQPIDTSKSNNTSSPSWMRKNKSHRQLFYSNLEEYYKKLYSRARERNTLEGVQACA